VSPPPTGAGPHPAEAGTGQPGRFRRRLVLNTASHGAANGWAMVVALVTLPVLLHCLGPVRYGLWAALQTFSARRGWLAIADLGLGGAATRSIALRAATGEKVSTRVVVGTALATLAVFGIVAGAVLALAGPLVLPTIFHASAPDRGGMDTAILFFAMQVPCDLVADGCGDCLSGLQRLDIGRALDAARRTLVAIATISAALLGGGLPGVAVASLGATVVAGIAGVVVLSRRVRPALPSITEARRLLGYGAAVGAAGAFGIVEGAINRTVVGIITGPVGVTLVDIASQVQSGADAVLASATSAVLPGAAWLRARGGDAQLRELLLRGTRYSLLVSAPVTVGAMVLAGPAIDIWLGGGYHAAVIPAVLALGYVLVAGTIQVASFELQGVGRARALIPVYAVTTVVNLGLTILLVFWLGPAGAFAASLVTLPLFMFPQLRLALRELGGGFLEFLRRGVFPVMMPTALMAAVAALALQLPTTPIVKLVLGVCAGMLLYCAVALRWSVSREEIAELRRLVRARGIAGSP